MANQVILWLPAIQTGLLALIATPCSASGFNPSHLPDYPNVVVEHAELVLSPEGIPDTAYLTIYNGTGSPVSVTQVTASGYNSAAFVKRSQHLFGYEEIAVNDADLAIPAMAELDMSQDAVFVTMQRDRELLGSVTITVGFDDGSLRSVPARIVETGRARTSHHHGASELE
ncbi:hypothetical protein ASD54_23545 [Rhizobium sp. Root149]|uniref:hypothetical protein n=1 Tax=Rhizobium sp. Root149 TaxID=1736473 RepID=UPI0007159AD6|nr:hypothetical protein [Rhizobium sp. Root149]KQZ59759.1 hypothetical protein ASD54_23545 [Rhizobium sp. Root149]